MEGELRIELRAQESKSCVLPLHYSPIMVLKVGLEPTYSEESWVTTSRNCRYTTSAKLVHQPPQLYGS